jgi:hypothetical protein
MDTLTFVVEMTKALGWPCAALVIVLVFRRPLLELLTLVRKVKYKDVEVELAKKEISEARELTTSKGNEKFDVLSFMELEHFRQLADISPRAAITEAWSRLEAAVYQAAQAAGMEAARPSGVSFSSVLAALKTSGAIDANGLRIIEKMRAIRNKAVHIQTEGLSASDAIDYVLAMKHAESVLKTGSLLEREPNTTFQGTLRDKAAQRP